jgi:hypothetical protein
MEQWRPDEPHGIKDAFSPEGRPLVSRVASGGVPASLFKLLEMADQKIDQVMGIRDLFENNQLPGQIRGSTAFERIEEISGLEWQALIRDYFSQLAMVKAKRNNRVRQFYTKDKMFAFVSRTGEDEVLEWKRDEQRDHQHRITIVPSSLTPEIRSMREDRIREQLNTPGMGMALYGNADRTDYDPSKLAQAMGMPEGEYRERAARERTLQSQENEEMEHGNQVPVYPYDDDSIHMDEMRTSMCDMGWRKKNSPETPVYEAYKAHLDAHSEQFANKNEAATTAEAAVTAQEMFRASMAQLMPQIIQQIGDMAAAQFEQVAGNSPGGPIAALQALDASAEGGDEYEQ